MRPPPPGCCISCPREREVPAVREFVDTFGYRYEFCERHYAPIARWQKRQQLAEEDRRLLRLAARLERIVR